MPTPNRYQGNGRAYPEGTIMGPYIMKGGRWKRLKEPTPGLSDLILTSTPSLKGPIWIGAAIALVIFVAALAALLLRV
ncbi:hypothetical protein [Pseudomonas phage PCS4]|uniref:Uncharacterized protein n=1 Tax=Pseudomonas phage PCS4 TaxID=2875705 RepID=A0ABY3P992_9CAUD|nr:hypothetical protein [Pseudomonas phage PCS4]UPW35198.1 hypothetical protein [Pseudomonas phage PCS5]UZZ63864.1 hypothetical protein PSV6_4 [Pseudomonas phage PSV6]WCD55457.1 hypothetical protein CCNLGMII_00003 [Pseudomonas phage phi C106]